MIPVYTIMLANMKDKKTLPLRSEVPVQDTWDLSPLYPEISLWYKDQETVSALIDIIPSFKGTLSQSAEQLKKVLDLTVTQCGQLLEKMGNYAHLKKDEDLGLSAATEISRSFESLYTRYTAATSYIEPEILEIPADIMTRFMASAPIKDYSIFLERIIRRRKHTLTEKEEKLLAMQSEFAGTAQRTFTVLTNVDMDFGSIKTEKGLLPLSQGTFILFLQDPNREIRQTAYNQFYQVFSSHKTTLAELYTGSVQRDIFKAKVRNYTSARQKALYKDNVPEQVYDTLIEEIHKGLPLLHHYYALRKKILGLSDLRHYDSYVSMVPDISIQHSYNQTVELTCKALTPLGDEYVSVLQKGLLEQRWVDRYENKGKRSGAYSSRSYNGYPYILMNYKESDIRQVFTLAHEAGHSMHSWFSARNNPFSHYSYTIFEAEVASTFNEQLLNHHLLKHYTDPNIRKFLLGRQLSDIVATLFRQTMFAEYEHRVHDLAETGKPLTLDTLRTEYGSLLKAYFGPDMTFEETSDLEGLRIPHFYRAFYVYKYATGLAASLALSKRVLSGGENEKAAYLNFLKSGGSHFPLDSLRIAGVNLSEPEPVKEAILTFRHLLEEFELLC